MPKIKKQWVSWEEFEKIQGGNWSPSPHAHLRSEVSDLFDSPFWASIPDKPSTFVPSAHALVGAKHTASGLTIGHVVRATGASAFAWAQLQHGDLGGVTSDLHHAQLHETAHRSGGGDALDHDLLAGFVAEEHVSLPNTIANVLTDHTKPVHDALGIVPGNHDIITYHTDSGLTIGHVIRATGAAAFAWQQLLHTDLGANHQNVTTTATPIFAALTLDTTDLSVTGGNKRVTIIGTGGYLGEFKMNANALWLRNMHGANNTRIVLSAGDGGVERTVLEFDGANNYTTIYDPRNAGGTALALVTRKLDDFGTPDDNTDLNATASRHGLLLKLGGGSVNFLRADGTWANPMSGAPAAHAASHEVGGSDLLAFADITGFGTYINQQVKTSNEVIFTKVTCPDADALSHFGRTAIGGSGTYADHAYFSHRDRVSAGNYALLQNAAGQTILNASAGQIISFRISHAQITQIDASGMKWGAFYMNSSFLVALNKVLDSDKLDGQHGAYYAVAGAAPTAHAASHHVAGGDLVNHDSLTGFVSNEHINHGSVSVIAGSGLSGGGTIAASRTLNLGALTGNWDAGSYQIRALKFYSDQATGVAPFTVLSTTKVTNLNADLLEGYHASSAASNNTIALRTSNGYLFCTYLNCTSGESAANPTHYFMEESNDSYLRQMTPANFVAQLAADGLMPKSGGIFTSHVYAANHGSASVDMIVNVCYGTGSPPAAGTTTIGTLWIKYTA